MKKIAVVLFLSVGLSLSIMAQSTHNIRTTTGLAVKDPQTSCWYSSFGYFKASTSWTEPSPSYPAAANFRGLTKVFASGLCTSGIYDFVLLSVTSTTDDEIDGVWDVILNGTTECSACNGKAYGLNQPAGTNYFKVYVDDPSYPGTEDWLFSGYIDSRFDF